MDRMWCCKCRCEATAESSADAGQPCCALCGTPLGGEVLPPSAHEASEARTAHAECAAANAAWDAGDVLPSASRIPHRTADPVGLLDDPELADDLRRAR